MYHSRNVGMVIGTAQLLLPMSSSTTSPAAQRHCAYPFRGLFQSSSLSIVQVPGPAGPPLTLCV